MSFPPASAVATSAGVLTPGATALQVVGTPDLTAFVGFTALVLSGFLLLARLSQGVVDGDPTGDGNVDDPPASGEAVEPTGSSGRAGPQAGDPAAGPARSAGVSDPVDAGRAHTDTAGGSDTAEPAETRVQAGTADGPTAPSDAGGEPVEVRIDAEAAETPAAQTLAGLDEAGPGPGPGEGSESPVESMSPGVLLANVALTQGLFGAVLAAAAWYFGVPGGALGLAGARVTGLAAVGVGVAFGLALWVGNELATAVVDAAGASYDEGLRGMLAPADLRGWVLLLGLTLPVIALVEEFLFRAAAVGAASAALGGPWALAVVSSAAFALGHGAQGRAGVAVTGALGFALAAGFVLTGSFLVVVVAHYLVNALEFGLHEGLDVPDPAWS